MLPTTSDGKARMALRDATRDAHDRVDALFSRLDLAQPADYARFLRAQAAAHLPVEAALDAAGAAALPVDWNERRRGDALVADLADLGLAAPAASPFPLAGDAAALLGAIYVLEGSRLGGAMLKRTMPAHFPQRFLGGGTSAGWRGLQQVLDRHLADPADRLIAIKAACDVFALFEREGAHILESDADVGG